MRDAQTQRGPVTALLDRWRTGDPRALDDLMPLVYAELRRLSRRHLARERADHTLRPTDLVHEAYLRLVGKDHPRLRDRAHFFAVAAQQMRRILVDHARARAAHKRGGAERPVTFVEDAMSLTAPAPDVLALDEALTELAELDPRKARIVEMRYFGGLTLQEAADVLELSVSTVNNETRLARAWLHRRVTASPPLSGTPEGRSS